MAKRKITVTVDEELVDAAQFLGVESLSAVVNAALAAEIDRRARAAALARQLAKWDRQFGPVSQDAARIAAAAWDDVDAVAESQDREGGPEATHNRSPSTSLTGEGAA